MQPTLRTHKQARPLRAILLLIGSLYIALSLITYSKDDPSWNFASSDPARIHNWGGIVGSYLADSLYQTLGLVAFLLTIGAFLSGVHFLRPRTILLLDTSSDKRPRWYLPVALVVLCVSLCGLLGLLPYRMYANISLGGAAGHFVAMITTFCFSTFGASLLLFGGLWASGFMILQRPFLISESLFAKWKDKTLQRFRFPKISLRDFFKRQKPSIHSPSPQKEMVSRKLEELFKKRGPAEQPAPDVSEPAPEAASPLKALVPKALDLFHRVTDTSDSDRVLLVDEAPKKRLTSQRKNSPFEPPSIQLLDLPEVKGFEISKEELIANSRALEQKLLDFGVQGHVTNIRPGPIITLYEFEPAAGVKVKNIVNLTDDLKLAMKAVSIRIIAPIPGRAAVGIEIPNPRRQTVYLREILQSALFQNSPSPLTLGMGKTTSGDAYVTDLSKMPHLLIAGATGSGKSVGLNGMIVSLLYKATPDELKFIMIDPKMLELSVYEGIPHLLLPVVTDPKKAARALAWACKEMERRYKLISSLGARNLRSYNEKVARLSEQELKAELEKAAQTEATANAIVGDEEDEEQKKLALQEAGLDYYVQLPHIVVVIDELADLIMVAARDVEDSIARLAQMARAAGIHLIIATQRPSVDVITGVIKANLPTRCAFQVASKVDSRTILDTSGAENLIGDGDMLFLPPGTSRLERLHGPFISEDEIARIVRHLKSQGDPTYNAQINLEETPSSSTGLEESEADDQLYDQALQVVFETKSPSASMLQRRLRVGYNRAARMIERMEREGIVSAPMVGGKGREILITTSYDSTST